MAIVLRIDNGDNRGRVDYARYVASPDSSPVTLRDRMNLPALLDFALVPADDAFLAPRRSAFVILTGLADALPPGGPRVPGALFSGYITNEPAVEFLGVRNGRPVHGYRYQATSEEYLLNVKRIGLLPPFLNQTAGAILRFLVERLQPGRFDTTQIAEGALVPFYQAGRDRSWSDVARELAERSGFYYRVLDGTVYFQPVGDLPAGVTVDERDSSFRPEALEVAPLGNPVQNDVNVFGGVEPQAYVREHFVGDSFTSRFPLAAAVYGAESARLLADDFTGVTLDPTRWEETDPDYSLELFDGRLNVTGGTGTLGETALRAHQALELGGELELIHGEYEFVAASTGLLGGLYSSATLTQANCLAGFDASPPGGTTRLRAVVLGAVQAAEVVVQPDHHYILVTRLSADRPHRTEQSFPSLEEIFGGASLGAVVKVALEVRDVDLANPAPPQTTVLYEVTLGSLPAFAFYAPINSADLHVVVNFLQVTRPIQARLETEIQVAGPDDSFSAPTQDVVLPGQPEKFSFVATQSGGWAFRARRRDALGWSPWSDEPQGQLPGETLVFVVQFFRARELDPSVGAAINAQNLLPNSEFFLSGIAGQEGTHAARYFALVNAAADGSEVDYSAAMNEMQWKSGVEFAAANPGFRSRLANLGNLFNPGEPLTFSAALRHSGSGTFPRVVRFALRSAATPAYDLVAEIPVDTITGDYQWYSVTFTLPASQAVPAGLSAEITVVVPANESLDVELFCDKVILNRGHRPAAFSLAPWDVVALAWNAGAGAYDLPATAVAATPRSADAGNAGRLAGTGTEDLDPDFTDRYYRRIT